MLQPVSYIEQVILVFFKGYAYYPKFVSEPFFRLNLREFCFSDFDIMYFCLINRIWSFFQVVFCVCRDLFFIEQLFLKLGIYEHHWYKSIITLIGFIPLFWIIKMWYDKLLSSSKNFWHYITLFLSSYVIILHSFMTPFRLFKIQMFKVKFFGEAPRDHKITSIIYHYLLIIIYIYLYKSKWHWTLKVLVFDHLLRKKPTIIPKIAGV